ncbi:MAG: FtsX-like permease family protein [Candidatus Bathyarchaeota archaeon]|nr:FtsX-like permease family protein [Candidatus Bathyarchaeota archaeon]
MSFTSIAIRNIPKRKLRNGLTVLAVILGVTLIVGVNIAFDSVYDQFGRTVNQAVGNVDIGVRSALNLPFNETTLNTVNATDGVADYYGRLNALANVSMRGDLQNAVLIGVNTTSDFDYNDASAMNITGQTFLAVNSSDAVFDDRLNCSIGKRVSVTVQTGTYPDTKNHTYTLKVVGLYHVSEFEEQYGGLFGQGYSGYRIFVDLTRAQTMLNATDKINAISIKLVDPEQTTQVVNELSSNLGTDYIVNPVKESLLNVVGKATSGLQSGLQIMSVMALCVAIVIVLNTMYMNIGERTHEIGILRSQGASTGQVFWIFFSESLILGIVGVSIGLVAGLFVTDIFRYFTARIFQPFSPGITFHLAFPPSTTQNLILGAAAGLLTVMLGGLFPALSACKTTIINALRPSMRKPGNQRTALKLVLIGLPLTIFGAFIFMWYDMFSEYGIGLYVVSALAPIAMLGVTLLAAGLLRSGGPVIERGLFAFGKTRKIISRNVERNLLRSTICFALIGISLSLVIVMGGAQIGTVAGVQNVIRSFSSSDLTVMSDDMISRDFTTNITKIEAINATTPVLVIPDHTILQNDDPDALFNSSSTVLAIDPLSYPKVMSMTFSEDTPNDVFERLSQNNTIILTSPLAKSLNVTVGDTVKIRVVEYENRTIEYETPQYSYVYHYTVPVLAWRNFTVVGVAQGAWLDVMSFGNFVLSEASYMSYGNVDEAFPDNDNYNASANLFFVKIDPGSNIEQTRISLQDAYGKEYKLSITTYDDAVERVQSSIDEIFYILYSIVLFAVLNAGIGVAAIMIMNVAERRREIGIFRSQGMSKPQVVTSIIGEATFLGVVGFAMGIVVGLMFHRVTVSYMRLEGFPMAFMIPYEAMAITLVLALLTAVISAVYPADKAAKQNIVDAIRT